MQKMTSRVVGAFMVSWLIGIGCLFVALQFSPPRWSVAAMSGALLMAAESSMIYVLPPLLILVLWTLKRETVPIVLAGGVACVWVVLSVGWWASSFSPVPWMGVVRNVVLLLPSALVPVLVFCLLLNKR